jgi:hypothetical protein
MKNILSLIICTCLSLSSFSQDFKTEFQKIFTTSIKGLESTKGGAMGGSWTTSEKLPGYTAAFVKKDEDLGVLYIQYSVVCTSEAEAKTLLAAKEKEVAEALPVAQFKKSSTYDMDFSGSMKTIFEFDSKSMSDVQKRPNLELGILDDNGTIKVILNLFEPYFKNQYKPGF